MAGVNIHNYVSYRYIHKRWVGWNGVCRRRPFNVEDSQELSGLSSVLVAVSKPLSIAGQGADLLAVVVRNRVVHALSGRVDSHLGDVFEEERLLGAVGAHDLSVDQGEERVADEGRTEHKPDKARAHYGADVHRKDVQAEERFSRVDLDLGQIGERCTHGQERSGSRTKCAYASLLLSEGKELLPGHFAGHLRLLRRWLVQLLGSGVETFLEWSQDRLSLE